MTHHTITTSDGTEIYYKDWGTGPPIVFSHGRPLSADAWEDQMFFLASRGYRCIAHEALAATPTAAFDAKWGSLVPPDLFAKLVYDGV